MFSIAASPVDGSWSIVSSPDADTTRQNELNGVTCISPSDCWAVGDYYTSANAYQTLIEQWDGKAWTIANSGNFLFDVNITGGIGGNDVSLTQSQTRSSLP